MKVLVLVCVAALLVVPVARASEQHPTQAELEGEVMCPVCGTTLDQSDSPAAQQIWAYNGYRPVNKTVLEANRKQFPRRPDIFTISNLGLGGWDKVQKSFFDPSTGVMASIERAVGGVTG